jgi:penicillin-binding protein 1A
MSGSSGEVGADPRPPPAPAARSELRRKLLRVAKWSSLSVLALALGGAVTVLLVIRHYEVGLPSVAELRSGYHPPEVTRVLARDGTLLASLFTQRRTVIPFKEIPDDLKLAFLAAEDARFYDEHTGLNYLGMLRALAANLRAGHIVQGGSTITQQVVKNLLLDPERTYSRKIRETILARRVEQELTKNQILELYLNNVYLGAGRYGVEEGARYYFGKKAKDLDVAEAAMLAGMVASPARFSPRRSLPRARERRRYVLDQMLDKGFVTRPLYEHAIQEPIRLAPEVEAESELAPEAVDYVKKVLQKVAGKRASLGGFVVTTTIDPTLQAEARQAVRDDLDHYAKRQKLEPPFTLKKRALWGKPFSGTPALNKIYVGTVTALDDAASTIDVRVGTVTGRVDLKKEDRYDPEHLLPTQFTDVGALLRVSLVTEPDPDGRPVPLRLELGPESALVAIDVRTRQVLALVGSYEALMGGLDRATDAHRQPGSSFKAFVYSYALHSRRFTPATVLDVPRKRGISAKEHRISVRLALAKSDNGAAQLVLDQCGAENVVGWAHALGIESRLEPTPSLALGAYEVTPLEITDAYATFPSGGLYAPPVLITKIVGPDGKVVPLPPEPPERRVMQPDEAYLTTSLLTSVIQEGTARRARWMGRPLAGKTGTTNQAKDAWFIGYSTDLVAGVWVGYDDALPLGWGEEGAVTALPAWMQFMKTALAKRPPTEFPRPTDIITTSIDPATGERAYPGDPDAKDEEFLDGTVPTEIATPEAGADGAAPRAGDAGAPRPASEHTIAAAARPDAGADAGSAEQPPPF